MNSIVASAEPVVLSLGEERDEGNTTVKPGSSIKVEAPLAVSNRLSKFIDPEEYERCKADLEYYRNMCRTLANQDSTENLLIHVDGLIGSSKCSDKDQQNHTNHSLSNKASSGNHIQVPSNEELVADFENSGGNRRFVLQVNVSEFPRFINRNKTLARAFCPKQVADGLFLFFSPLGFVLMVISLASTVIGAIGVVGIMPELGFAGLGLLPYVFLFVMHFNVDLTRSVMMSFDFWGLTSLMVVATAGLVDAVSHSPPRVIGTVMAGITLLVFDTSDARFPTRRKNYGYIVSAFSGVVYTWSIIFKLLWNTGQFQDVRQRTVKIYNVTFDLQSFSISCLTTFAILSTRQFLLLLFAGRETNMMLVIKPRAYYKVYDRQEQEKVLARFSKTIK